MKSKQGYVEAVNITRGVAIFLAVLGHAFLSNGTGLQKYLFNFIYGFHMPLFFFISGYCNIGILSKTSWHDIKNALGKRFCRLMLPYLSFGIIYVFLDIIGGKYTFADFDVAKYALELLKGDNANWQLWTLYVLFTSYALTILLHRMLPLKWMLGLSGILFIIMSVLQTIPGLPSWMFFTVICKTAEQWFFFVAGISIRKYWDFFNKPVYKSRWLFAGILLLACISILRTVFDISWLVLVTAPLGTLCFSELSKHLSETKWKNLPDLFGTNSMDIYIFANIFQVLVREVLFRRFAWPETVCILLSLVAGLFIPIVTGKYIVRRFYPLKVLLLGDLSRERRKNGNKQIYI